MVAADSKTKLLQDAERYVLHGKIQQAISEYLKIIQLDPNDVLILNTIGDLYLRRSNSAEANRYFSQVAENYVRNNFFLKAIAVYKKILSADPNNLEINLTMASLYAKQGLSIDARNQYLRVAALYEANGKAEELLEAYEKIVELDPANTVIQRKLAELHLAEGANDKAHTHWTGAARAQAQAGDLAGAVDSFKRAMELDPLDADAMRSFLECCQEMEEMSPALDQLKKSVEMAPDNLDLREMLGQAHLANRDPEAATKDFQMVVSMDESRYQNFFPVAEALIDKGSHDQALGFLDIAVPILISRRETEHAVKLYELILERRPKHIPALARLASICSATGDQYRYLKILDEIADHYLNNQSPVEAIEYLERIIRANPESEKHRKLHFQAFTEAYPDTPYVPPMESQVPPTESGSAYSERDTVSLDGESPNALVEIDLLINYGMREKALSLLLNQEARDPYDKEVRVRLLSLYKAEKKHTEAAEQCLLLAALHRREKNEELAQGYLGEAKQLAPDMAAYEADLDAFARRNGLAAKYPAKATDSESSLNPESEVDLSADVLDIFFAKDQESATAEDSEAQAIQEVITESYSQDMSSQIPSKSVQEQLQEVDFYIRLGFHDEALTKLNEIAKINRDNPELALRYSKLEEIEQPATQEPLEAKTSSQSAFEHAEATPSDDLEDFRKLQAEDGPVAKAERNSAQPRLQNVIPFESAKSDSWVNEMFADLMEEISSPDAAMASFEEHFSLGTAYREMELVEEAIREFQSALKSIDLREGDPKVIQCCGMLSTCFLKKNMPRSALRWCQAGLSIVDISSHEAMALRYDMGIAHLMAGSNERALECFDQIFDMDPSYRDVAQRIDELKGGFERHAP